MRDVCEVLRLARDAFRAQVCAEFKPAADDSDADLLMERAVEKELGAW